VSISDEARLEVLNDHYKDTCERIRENVGIRDRLFLFTLVVIGFHFFQISDRDQSSQAVVSLLKERAGFQITANTEVLTAILWFLLLAIVVRYFQANVYVNRQYDYLHNLETSFEKLIGHKLVSREGHAYLSNYPRFSNWMHFLYTWAFPVLLLITVTYKICFDWVGWKNIVGPFTFSLLSYAMIIVSTILYLNFLHRKKKP